MQASVVDQETGERIGFTMTLDGQIKLRTVSGLEILAPILGPIPDTLPVHKGGQGLFPKTMGVDADVTRRVELIRAYLVKKHARAPNQ